MAAKNPLVDACAKMGLGIIASSKTKDLSSALVGFDALAEYKQKSKIFKSVLRSDSYYGEASFAASLCDVCESLGDLTTPFPPDAGRSAATACKTVASHGKDRYEPFFVYAICTHVQLLSKWMDVYNGTLRKMTQQHNADLAQAMRLRDAGMNPSSFMPQFNQKHETFNMAVQLMRNKLEGLVDYTRTLFVAMAENLEDPGTIDSESLSLFTKTASTVDNAISDILDSTRRTAAISPLTTKINNALSKNRRSAAQAKRRAAEEERKRKEAERQAEEKRRAEQRKRAIEAWWRSHPKEKAELESRIKNLEDQISEADRECDDLRKKQQEAIRERDEKGVAETEQEEIHAQLAELRRKLSSAESRKIPLTCSEIERNAANSKRSSKRSELDRLVATVVSAKDSALPSAKIRDDLVSEIDGLEKELASLGVFSWGKKRKLTDLIAQKKSELEGAKAQVEDERNEETARLEQERQDSIARLHVEIADLEAEIARLGTLAADERAAAEAEKRREIDEAKAKVDELEPIAKQAMKHAEADKKARRNKLQPVIDDAGRAFTATQRKKEALQRDLAKAKGELESPNLPREFLANYMS